MITSRVVGALEASRAFVTLGSVAAAKTTAAAAYHGKQYQAAVKRRASGRPGPNVITGKYRNSIQFQMIRTGVTATAVVWSDHPASHRLERGFVGVDSAGRTVDAPPYPHWEPDIEETANGMQRTMAAIVDGGGTSRMY